MLWWIQMETRACGASGSSSQWAFSQLIPSRLCKNKSIVNCQSDGSEVLCRVLGPGIVSRCGLLSFPDRFPPPRLPLHAGDRLLQVLWLPATISVAVCRFWCPPRLWMCAKQIILGLELALRQPGSCGWLVSLARRLWRGSPVALVEWELVLRRQPGHRHRHPGPSGCLTAQNKGCAEVVMKSGESVQRKGSIKSGLDHRRLHTLSPDSRPHARRQHVINADYLNFTLRRDSPLTRVCLWHWKLNHFIIFPQFED